MTMNTLPQNEFAERSLIGLLLNGATTIDALKSLGVTSDHYHACKTPYQHVSKYLATNQADVTLFIMAAHESGLLDEVGGAAFYTQCAFDAFESHLISYVKTVRRCHGERLMHQASLALAKNPTSSDAVALLKKGEREIKQADKLTPEPEPTHDDERPADDVFDPTGNEQQPSDRILDMPFRFLGMDDGIMRYMPDNGQHIVSLTPPSHTKLNLLQLAPMQSWEMAFPGSNGTNWDAASNALIQFSQALPKFDPRSIRGRGCWIDGEDVIYHAGNKLAINGIITPIPSYNSHTRSIYEAGLAIALDTSDVATNAQASLLLDLCDSLAWDHPLNGKLLAGWMALAPICGAMGWRPHVWVTGAAGTGKSWVMNNIVHPMLGRSVCFVQGNTTEAGIRGQLGSDALPVMFDEAESENDRGKNRMDSVMELARQASTESGAGITKGTASGGSITYMVRSMFCFSSIGVAATKKADTSRISTLSLKKCTDGHFEDVIKKLWRDTVANNEFCSRIRARSVKNAITTRKNSETFSAVAVRFTGDKRTSDQVGTLLAGAFSLTSVKLITPQIAETWMTTQDWSAFKVDSLDSDENHCYAHLMASPIRIEHPQGSENITIDEAIMRNSHDCDSALARIGIKNEGDGVIVANNHQGLERVFANSPWSGSKWRGQLLRITGAKTCENAVRFTENVRSRSVFIPKSVEKSAK